MQNELQLGHGKAKLGSHLWLESRSQKELHDGIVFDICNLKRIVPITENVCDGNRRIIVEVKETVIAVALCSLQIKMIIEQFYDRHQEYDALLSVERCDARRRRKFVSQYAHLLF